MLSHRLPSIVLAALVVTACTQPEDITYGESSSEISVGTAVTSSCSTATVRGLSIQIAQEVECMSPTSLVKLSPTTRIKFASSAVLPYMHSRAKADLVSAANVASLSVNSGYRTVAQQYLLYRWDQLGRCGIAVAATPGNSNHESGRAVDLGNWSSRVGVMGSHHWSHSVPGDPVHFDNTRSPDNRGQDVKAFQRLWNRNHPGDKISVDGDYGPQTAARLKKSPGTGFAKGAFCKAVERGTDLLATLLLCGAVLQEAAERRHAGAGADHDDRRPGIGRRTIVAEVDDVAHRMRGARDGGASRHGSDRHAALA